MIENDKDKIKKLRDKLEEGVNIYNKLNPGNEIELVEKKNTNSKVFHEVSDKYICFYKGNCIGLFKQQKYYGGAKLIGGSVVSTEELRVYINSKGLTGAAWYNNGVLTAWYKSGEKALLNSPTIDITCDMTDAINFNEVRNMMKDAGLILKYDQATATDEEIDEVISFAKFTKAKYNYHIK